jgi:hypothetical protein
MLRYVESAVHFWTNWPSNPDEFTGMFRGPRESPSPPRYPVLILRILLVPRLKRKWSVTEM